MTGTCILLRDGCQISIRYCAISAVSDGRIIWVTLYEMTFLYQRIRFRMVYVLLYKDRTWGSHQPGYDSPFGFHRGRLNLITWEVAFVAEYRSDRIECKIERFPTVICKSLDFNLNWIVRHKVSYGHCTWPLAWRIIRSCPTASYFNRNKVLGNFLRHKWTSSVEYMCIVVPKI